ncbi:MAG: HI0074 family nucleotidyltransferase substrate-binding subunit [Snowella sp.]
MQSFEYTHELAWNLLRDYLRDQRTQDIYGSRDATRIAFSVDLIEDGDSWMDMIKDCTHTSHTYNKVTAKAIAEKITTRFGKKSTKEL